MTEILRKIGLYINHNPGCVFAAVFVFALVVNVYLFVLAGGLEPIVGVLLCLYGLHRSREMNQNA